MTVYSWQRGGLCGTFSVLNFSHVSIKLKNQNKKFQTDSNILASPVAGQGNCLPYV